MDSGVSRIQMWQEQKKKERQEKRRAHYEKNQEEIIEKVVEARKKSQEARKKSREAKSGHYGMFQSKTPNRNVGANETSRR